MPSLPCRARPQEEEEAADRARAAEREAARAKELEEVQKQAGTAMVARQADGGVGHMIGAGADMSALGLVRTAAAEDEEDEL